MSGIPQDFSIGRAPTLDEALEYIRQLKEKERARSQIMDSKTQKIDELERSLDISNKILNDYKDKWHRTQEIYGKALKEAKELREVLSLWEEHGSLATENCEGCRRAEYYRVTGILLPRKDE